MPKLSGIVLTTKIREIEGEFGKRVSIIGISGHALEEERRRCIEGGMDDYITKPIDIAVLRQSFEKCADAIAAAN